VQTANNIKHEDDYCSSEEFNFSEDYRCCTITPCCDCEQGVNCPNNHPDRHKPNEILMAGTFILEEEK